MACTPLQATRINGGLTYSPVQCHRRNGNRRIPCHRSVGVIIHSCQHPPPRPDNSVDPSGSTGERTSSIQRFASFIPVCIPSFQTFSRLPYVEWDLDSVVTFMVSYISIFHVPLGFGGLTVLAQQLKVNDIAPETKAVALAFLLLLELGGTICLIKSSMKQSKSSFECFNFRFKDATGSRGWMVTTIVGLTLIAIAMGFTTSVMEFLQVTIPDDAKAKVVKQMASNSIITEISTFLVGCILTPCLEEIVYRGYLLQSMTSGFGWQWAVVLSSCAFTVAHVDILGAPSLFFVGCVLGASYTWSGNLVSNVLIHSLYNAFIIYGR